jgi:hypothetical protein
VILSKLNGKNISLCLFFLTSTFFLPIGYDKEYSSVGDLVPFGEIDIGLGDLYFYVTSKKRPFLLFDCFNKDSKCL